MRRRFASPAGGRGRRAQRDGWGWRLGWRGAWHDPHSEAQQVSWRSTGSLALVHAGNCVFRFDVTGDSLFRPIAWYAGGGGAFRLLLRL